jgi:transcriptional regulator GlxA family with amidase domain
VIVPGFDVQRVAVPRSLLVWLQRNRDSGADFCAICTGAFVLGQAGFLNGVRCTTHWKRLPELQRRYAKARVTKDRLFVTDGRITTSAGVASGIDVALWFVERHYGPIVAARTAREMVVHVRRDGSHQQDNVYLDYRAHLNSAVHRVQDFLIAHPAEKLRLPELARIAGTSTRALTRAFRAATGVSIAHYRQQIRLENARSLLQVPSATVERVAEQVGFDDPRQLRRLWNRQFGSTPSASKRH